MPPFFQKKNSAYESFVYFILACKHIEIVEGSSKVLGREFIPVSERKEEEFIPCIAHETLAETIMNKFCAGSHVCFEGKIRVLHEENGLLRYTGRCKLTRLIIGR